jgi:undecaprenyl diphosphate synthase
MVAEKKKKKSEKPKCVAMIMDGNRRWARSKNLHAFRGHQAGYEKMKEVIGWCVEEEIPNLILYAFSIENWQRDEREVSYLMRLVRLFLKKELTLSKKNGIRISYRRHVYGAQERYTAY